jgi:hypothetical protein
MISLTAWRWVAGLGAAVVVINQKIASTTTTPSEADARLGQAF